MLVSRANISALISVTWEDRFFKNFCDFQIRSSHIYLFLFGFLCFKSFSNFLFLSLDVTLLSSFQTVLWFPFLLQGLITWLLLLLHVFLIIFHSVFRLILRGSLVSCTLLCPVQWSQGHHHSPFDLYLSPLYPWITQLTKVQTHLKGWRMNWQDLQIKESKTAWLTTLSRTSWQESRRFQSKSTEKESGNTTALSPCFPEEGKKTKARSRYSILTWVSHIVGRHFTVWATDQRSSQILTFSLKLP